MNTSSGHICVVTQPEQRSAILCISTWYPHYLSQPHLCMYLNLVSQPHVSLSQPCISRCVSVISNWKKFLARDQLCENVQPLKRLISPSSDMRICKLVKLREAWWSPLSGWISWRRFRGGTTSCFRKSLGPLSSDHLHSEPDPTPLPIIWCEIMGRIPKQNQAPCF